MKKYILAALIIFAAAIPAASAQLLINEFTTRTSDDWIELMLVGGESESMDISGLIVAVNYSKSSKNKKAEKLSEEPITLCTKNLPDTPYDDRFAVVHVESEGTTETDELGDVNGNGIRDIYRHSTSPYNTNGTISIIDTDTNVIIDFAAYSNRNGKDSTIKNHIENAVKAGQWKIGTPDNIQMSCIDIGSDGLSAYMSVCRKGTDTNTAEDFVVSKFQTPGAENLIDSPVSESSIFRVNEKKVFCKKTAVDKVQASLFVSQICSMRIRVFTATGRLLYESSLYKDVFPGHFKMSWGGSSFRNAPGGMYIGIVEATGGEIRGTVSRRVFFILGR